MIDLRSIEPIAPVNLRIEPEPYPHLRDDEGCILSRDFGNWEKVSFILRAVDAAIAGAAKGAK